MSLIAQHCTGQGVISERGSKKLNLNLSNVKGMARSKGVGQLFSRDHSPPNRDTSKVTQGQQSKDTAVSKIMPERQEALQSLSCH